MKKNLLLKKQIAGLTSVAETVKAVEKIAAAQIHLLKKQVRILASYKNGVEAVLARLARFEQNKNHPLLQSRETGPRALLIVAGDKGLVGGLYHNLINKFLEQKHRYQEVWVLGSKAKEYLAQEAVAVNQLSNDSGGELLARFQKKPLLQSVDVLHPLFISVAQQQPALTRFLPFNFTSLAENTPLEKGPGWPLFEPSKKELFNALLKKYLGVFLRQIILEARLSELSARTVTAEHAVSKTKTVLQKLNRAFFKERERSITQKQLESFAAHKTLR